MLRVHDLVFGYPGMRPWTFSFEVPKGESLAVVGPSGAGKSTLLNLIAGFERPQTGTVSWDGRDITHIRPSDRGVSLLSQSNHLFEHLTAAKNIDLGMAPNRRPTEAEVQARNDAMGELGIEGLQDRLVTELSGGQQQRVALARCLVSAKPIVLLDEPFSALDDDARKDAQRAVATLLQHGKTLVFVTHQLEDVGALNSEVMSLDTPAKV